MSVLYQDSVVETQTMSIVTVRLLYYIMNYTIMRVISCDFMQILYAPRKQKEE